MHIPFVWSDASQPPARWHAAGDGPANYFADTPIGAWAEFLRHEGIKDAANLVGVERALWAVELPDTGYAAPKLSTADLTGGLRSYAACQAEATRLRSTGVDRVEAPSAALVASGARGWVADPSVRPAPRSRDGKVWVLFGLPRGLVGWPAVEFGAPSARVLPLVHHF